MAFITVTDPDDVMDLQEGKLPSIRHGCHWAVLPKAALLHEAHVLYDFCRVRDDAFSTRK